MKRYRLTESNLRNIIRESVANVLNEKFENDPGFEELEKKKKRERDNMRRADKRWNKSADKRPLHRKGSANRDLKEEESKYKYLDDEQLSKKPKVIGKIDLPDEDWGTKAKRKIRLNREKKDKANESILRGIIREAVKSVLGEGIKGIDPSNVVSEHEAINNGFEREYGGFDGGLELWGKDLKDPREAQQLKKILGITRFTTTSETKYGYHVRITVKTNPKKYSPEQRLPDTIGDYVSTGYGDNKGTIFHNPKNGHSKHFYI